MPSQQQTMQRIMPVIFAYFYLVIPAAVVIYMIISTGIRIITQDIMFRTGISNPVSNGVRPLAAAERTSTLPVRWSRQRRNLQVLKPPSQPRAKSRPQSRAAPDRNQIAATASLKGEAKEKGALTHGMGRDNRKDSR